MSTPPGSDRSGLEESGQELGHLPSGDHAVGRESRLRGPLGYLKICQLVDGNPDVTCQAPDVPKALIGRVWNHDPGRPGRPYQEERHLPSGHLTAGIEVPRGSPLRDLVVGQTVDRRLGCRGDIGQHR